MLKIFRITSPKIHKKHENSKLKSKNLWICGWKLRISLGEDGILVQMDFWLLLNESFLGDFDRFLVISQFCVEMFEWLVKLTTKWRAFGGFRVTNWLRFEMKRLKVDRSLCLKGFEKLTIYLSSKALEKQSNWNLNKFFV